MRKKWKSSGTVSAVLPEMVQPRRLFQYHPPIPQKPVRVMVLLLKVVWATTPDVSIPQSNRLDMLFPEIVSDDSSLIPIPSSACIWPEPTHFPSMTFPVIWLFGRKLLR